MIMMLQAGRAALTMATLLTFFGINVSSLHTQPRLPPDKPNVLYIVVDDLRVELPIYGHKHVIAPNLETLANRSLVFDRAFCNQPVCSPSRNSFMSGRRPDTTKIWNFKSDFRAIGPNWTTLPGHFKHNGYLTLGTGKLYHEGHPTNGDGIQSWTNVSTQFSCNGTGASGGGGYCDPKMATCDVAGPPNAPNPRWCPVDAPMNGSAPGVFLCDVQTLNDARIKMRFAAENRRSTGQPFFLGVGLRKPHLDWRVPSGYLDLYPTIGNVSLPAHQVAQKQRPPVSIHSVWRSSNEKTLWKGWGYVDPWTPMRPTTSRDMRRHYWAATSYMDFIVGELLSELESTNFASETLVVFHSDHGWSLGENGDWRKFSLTELGTRVPLMVSVPWLTHTHGKRTSAIAELVDVMPTMSDLAGLPHPLIHPGDAPLDGTSLLPLFSQSPPVNGVKDYALQVYPRCPVDTSQLWAMNWCIDVDDAQFGWMGYSLRSKSARYTAWCQWNGTSLTALIPEHGSNGTDGFYNELFTYESGLENVDELELVEMGPSNPDLVASMHAVLLKMIHARL